MPPAGSSTPRTNSPELALPYCPTATSSPVHHVIRQLDELIVLPTQGDAAYPATYAAQYSRPESDIVVLRAPGLKVPPIQIGGLRTGVEAYGVGYRPSELAQEPHGRLSRAVWMPASCYVS